MESLWDETFLISVTSLLIWTNHPIKSPLKMLTSVNNLLSNCDYDQPGLVVRYTIWDHLNQ